MTSKARRGGGELMPVAPRILHRPNPSTAGEGGGVPTGGNGNGNGNGAVQGNGAASANGGKIRRAAGSSGWVHRGRSLEERLPPQPKA
jgi:hypothetical protein